MDVVAQVVHKALDFRRPIRTLKIGLCPLLLSERMQLAGEKAAVRVQRQGQKVTPPRSVRDAFNPSYTPASLSAGAEYPYKSFRCC